MAKPYTSLSAYLAHWRALRNAGASVPDDPLLSQMNQTIAEILGDEQRYLIDDAADSAASRRRERAETRLRHELIQRGVIVE